ncbi:hypothetical protein V8F06_005008 [Rhypophila decipiens]
MRVTTTVFKLVGVLTAIVTPVMAVQLSCWTGAGINYGYTGDCCAKAKAGGGGATVCFWEDPAPKSETGKFRVCCTKHGGFVVDW